MSVIQQLKLVLNLNQLLVLSPKFRFPQTRLTLRSHRFADLQSTIRTKNVVPQAYQQLL